MKKLSFGFLFLSLILQSCNSGNSSAAKSDSTSLPPDSVMAIAKAAFVYGMPLVLMDLTRKKITNTVKPINGRAAPINQLTISSEFPNAKFRDVVRPNADTYYNTGFLQLSDGPLVLTVPNTNGRYYLLPMVDAWTNIFASPGKRTTGTLADTFLITGPKWTGTVPAGMKELKSPTSLVWLLGRIQVNSALDGTNVVVPIEKKIKLVPLSAWGKSYTAPDGKFDSSASKLGPNEQLASMPINDYFSYINQLMVDNPPAAADSAVIANFAKIGVGPGLKFDLSSFDSTAQTGLKKLPLDVMEFIKKTLAEGKLVPLKNGWSIAYKGFGTYGTDYDLRAFVDVVGLGANLPEDAVYPSTSVDSAGNPYNGANKYLLHFAKGQTPPVHAFWSMTMYDNDGYFTENAINRYAIGNRNPLKYNADSSVDLYFQHVSPGKDKENNWLPAPSGSFNLMLRMYWPAEEFLKGNWTPPAVVKTK